MYESVNLWDKFNQSGDQLCIGDDPLQNFGGTLFLSLMISCFFIISFLQHRYRTIASEARNLKKADINTLLQQD